MDHIENRSRQELEGDADELNRKLAEQVERQDLTVEDKHEVKVVAAGLSLDYSKDAGDGVSDLMTEAGAVLDGLINDQRQEHAEQASESVEAEGLTEHASREAEEDRSSLEKAAGEVTADAAKATLTEAASSSEEERGFESGLHDRIEADRVASEEETKRQVEEVHSTTVSTRRSGA